MPQKEPLPQNGGTTPPAPEIAQSGRLLMHVLRLHRKARVGFFENLLLPCAAPAAPADPKAVRQKGEGGLTRRKKRRAAGASCRAAFFRTAVRRRMRETQSVRQRTGKRGRFAGTRKKRVFFSPAQEKSGRFDGAGKRSRFDGVLRICDSPAPFVCVQTGFPFPVPTRGGNRARRARVFQWTGPPPERASRRRQSEAPGEFVQNGH